MTARSQTRDRKNYKRRQRVKVLKRAGVSCMEQYLLQQEAKGIDRMQARNMLRVRPLQS